MLAPEAVREKLSVGPRADGCRSERAVDVRSSIADRRLKRSVDLALTFASAVVVAPLALAVAAAVKATSPGPVLFRQERVGRDGTPFEMLKFRTMRNDSEDVLRADQTLWAAYVEHD